MIASMSDSDTRASHVGMCSGARAGLPEKIPGSVLPLRHHQLRRGDGALSLESPPPQRTKSTGTTTRFRKVDERSPPGVSNSITVWEV